MSGSRENSPDWLHCFKPPTATTFELSSDSAPSSPVGSPSKEDRTDSDDNEVIGKVLGGRSRTPRKGQKLEDGKPPEKNKSANQKKRTGDKAGGKVSKKVTIDELKPSVLALSSDSESSPQLSPISDDHKQDSPSKKASKDKSPKKELQVDGHTTIKEEKSSLKKEASDDVEMKEEEAPEKQVESQVSSGRFPLILSEKVQRTKALVECEGDSIDLAGDVGAVGRVVISDTASGDHEMYLDLKGTIYKTTIVPSRTFCVVSFGQSEAKIEAIMNDFIQLKPQSNVFESETMVEGTLDGFSFDSDEEGEKVPKAQQTEHGEDAEEKTNGKSKRKAEKTSGVARKRGRAAGGKAQPQKKAKRKAPVSKKAKAKK